MSQPHEPPDTIRSAVRRAPAPRHARGSGRTAALFVRYLLLGLLMGALWAYQHDASLWEHAVRLLGLLLIVPPLLHRAQARRRRRLGQEDRPRLSLVRLSLGKVGIVACALLAAWLLEDRVAGADHWIAGGLTVVVAVGGPLLHPRLIVGAGCRSVDPAVRG
ncbi:hypothetical protein [Streptomyces sp. NBC_00687]|uniref:hypothetical protein n=1 Tax=Streptomyces sp. NBC_00687 TaxID=2975807 RepID=UPI00224FDD45|nr:hypothetical protein [Streptomyces sp. NBC_00687]MCX4919041.1 hypothetical protein [Streptomyces sp. NBC_00687]